MRSLAALVVVAAWSAAVALASAPDAQFKFATLVGTVTDSNGSPMPGATIRATNTANGLHREVTTGADGTYTMVNIQPGTYDYRISLASSTMFERRGITVRAGDIARVDAQLKATTTRGSGLRPPPSTPDAREVQVGLYTYAADGRPNAMAAIGEMEEFTAFLSADEGMCSLTSGAEPDRVPHVGWRISGRVLGRTPEALTVRIAWQRLWESGARQSKPQTGTLEATIRTGERFPLDSVTSAAGPPCEVTGGSLEATVIVRPARAGGGSGGRTAAPPAGANPPLTADRASAAAEELRRRARAQFQELARAAPNAFQVELWLVQTRPDATERVQLITQPLGASTSFVFPPVRLSSASDAAEVEVFGSLRRTQSAEGAGQLSLQVAIGRNLRQPGARPVESYSASGKVVPWPLPAEVLSFELPVSASDQRVLAGHRFDLRIRLTPR
jgi:hypothetical protein